MTSSQSKGKINASETPEGKALRRKLSEVVSKLPDAEVKRLMVGVHMTSVWSNTVGCAYTWREDIGAAHLCAEVIDSGKIRGTSARELAQRLNSSACLERSVGMAAINSLLNTPRPDWQPGDILAHMSKRFAGAKVAMVGHFPFAPEIRKWAGEFHIIEKKPVEDDLSEEAGFDWLARCEVLIITGVTILNDTLPGIIKAAPQAWKMMLGPTIPLHETLLDLGINALTGIVSENDEVYWQGLEEGAIVPRYRGCTSVVLSREKLDLPPGDFRPRICELLDRGD
jgi:uncharacterized protein (DUF4213/DUF364 family)